ncbi:MAG: hypothetical protein GY769_03015 [bacterium]|nr:hypothetical protein [bacterium]
MRAAISPWTMSALALTGVIAACSKAPEPLQEAKLETSAAHGQVENEAPLAEPNSEGSLQITDFIRLWVASAAGDDDVYDIPERADKNVAGVLTTFHKVHQTKESSYAVCVDFEDGENTYDVDFFVNRTADGLVVEDHYLHQVNGESIE